MGLDITAYRRITKSDETTGAFYVVVNHDFPGRAGNLETGFYVSPDRALDFRAGSYSGYNEWREQLAKLAGYPAAATSEKPHSNGAWQSTEGPFWELINFSDCEGALGTFVCAKLSRDFAKFADGAQKIGGWFYDRYVLWHNAMSLGADNGVVCFH